MNMNIFPDYNVMKKAPKQNIKDQTATDYWLEKGDYVNFDYVTLGWNVPIEKVETKEICPFPALGIYVVNNNPGEPSVVRDFRP